MFFFQQHFFSIALWGILAVALITGIVLLFVTAPYGRHMRKGWGPAIGSTTGWIVMESIAVVTIAALFFIGERRDPISITFLAMWELHYLNRTFVYPLRRQGRSKPMPMSVMGMAMVFNLWNGYLNGAWLFHLGPARGTEWLTDPRFVAGAVIFLVGMFINHQSDGILFKLRASGEIGYRVPRGGLFRFVTMPNYLGELLEWTGWALATWSLAGLSFAIFTAANLIPRALTNHRWYQEQFPEYPSERKAVIPFIL